MEQVLLGIAAPAAAGAASSLAERSLQTVAQPFNVLLQAFTSIISPVSERATPETIENLQSTLESLSSELAEQIRHGLRRAGIDLTEAISMRISAADGRLEVVGDHPQKALVEAALADSPELVDKFAEIESLSRMLGAANKLERPNMSDSEALSEDEPAAAIALFSVDSDGATLKFT